MQQYIPDFKMNINVSYVQIMHGNVERDILDVIKKYGLQPDSICIEMTESGFMDMHRYSVGSGKYWMRTISAFNR